MSDLLPSSQKNIAHGFFTIAFMIFMMIVIGGITRLTGSGLSIVEWKPIMGFFPPFSQHDWQILFDQYQHSPEFLKINYMLDLEGFKNIFWLEYIHRLWGRLIGIVLIIPTFLILKNKAYRKTYGLALIALWILGLGQGVLGWYMVKSGLISDPHVSPYRLTAHLLMGILLLGISLSAGLKALMPLSLPSSKHFRKRFYLMIGMVVITATFGGLVAGLKAGLIYNTFPLMGDNWLPEEAFFMNPLWKNFTENPAMVQWTHRMLATMTVLTILIGLYSLKSVPYLLWWRRILTALILCQFGLGILTVLYQAPLVLASLHQGIALLLFIGLLLAWRWAEIKIIAKAL